jgi:WD40 repeat protein
MGRRTRHLALGAAVLVVAAAYGVLATGGRAEHARSTSASSPGTQVWARRFAGPGDSLGSAVAYSPDGTRVFVTGATSDDQGAPRNDDLLTAAYDASTGATIWTRRYAGSATGADDGRAIRVAPDGATVFVTGTSESPAGAHDYITFAYDAATGALKWRKRFDSTFHLGDDAAGLALSPDGSAVFVTGDSVGATGDYDLATVSYDATTGAMRWIARYRAPETAANYANAIAVSPDGSRVVVTGQTQDASSFTFDVLTVAYAASTGGRLWTTRYDGPSNLDDTGNAIAFAPTGSVVYVGGTLTESQAAISPNADFATFALDAATGAQQWLSTYDGAQQDEQDVVEAIAASPDGSKVFVTGPSIHHSSGGSLHHDYATVGYAAGTGAKLWASRYDGPAHGEDFPLDLAVAPNGSQVLVTGRSVGLSGTLDFETVAYTSPHGFLVWQRRQNGAAGGDDTANALAISPDSSKVVVAGTSDGGPSAGLDWLLLAYTLG